MLFAEGAKARGLAYLEKKKRKGDESARVGGDAPEHNGRSSVGSVVGCRTDLGCVESMLNFDQFRKRSHS